MLELRVGVALGERVADAAVTGDDDDTISDDIVAEDELPGVLRSVLVSAIVEDVVGATVDEADVATDTEVEVFGSTVGEEAFDEGVDRSGEAVL